MEKDLHVKLFLKDIDQRYEKMSDMKKRECAELLKIMTMSRAEVIAQVFGSQYMQDPKYLRLMTLVSKEFGIQLSEEKKKEFGKRGGKLYYQKMVAEFGAEEADRRRKQASHKGVELSGRTVYSEEEKAFIMEQKALLGSVSGANIQIANECNLRFHGGREVRKPDALGKQYNKRIIKKK